jgi:predicted amidohydrolase
MIDTTCTVALAQTDVIMGMPSANLAVVRELAARAHAAAADLLVLPELWGSGYDLEHAAEHARQARTLLLPALHGLARRHELYILGSLLLEGEQGRVYNTVVLASPRGRVVPVYRKAHLFGPMHEPAYLGAGERGALLALPWGLFGLAVCYDLRFPELFQRYREAGAHAVIVPAQWPEARESHWCTLLRARAIDTQMFVLGCNRVGVSQGVPFAGRSAVVDPWGELLAEATDEAALVVQPIDLARAAAVREAFPVHADRRPEVYDRHPNRTEEGAPAHGLTM